MPLPSDPVDASKVLLRWTKDDVYAADFLAKVAELARLIDDAVDEPAAVRQDAYRKVWSICLVDLPMNPFWVQHGHRLSLVMNECILSWAWSDELKTSGDMRRETFGYVLREATDRIAVAVAHIVGGSDFAARVMREVYDVCHMPSTETVAEWVGSDT